MDIHNVLNQVQSVMLIIIILWSSVKKIMFMLTFKILSVMDLKQVIRNPI